MLTSISPLGERGRGHRWGVTMGWLFAGHVLGGLLLGGVLAAGAAALDAAGAGDHGADWRATAAIAAATVAVLADALGWRAPGRRQVDENWLSAYRGWVYGLGFGVQLGFGFVTVINSAMLFAMAISAVLAGPAVAVAVGVVHGVVRGALAAVNARVRTVDDLKSLHRRLDRSAERVRLAVPAVMAVLVGGLLVGGVIGDMA